MASDITSKEERIAMSVEAYCNYCIKHETDVEAGYVNDPTDLGKETNHGITIGTAKRYKTTLKRDFGWNGKMIDLTQEMAYAIYKWEFWDKMLLDTMCEKYSRVLARIMFRWGLKSGVGRPVNHLQRLLNIFNNREAIYEDTGVDGAMGPSTLRTLDELIEHRGKQDTITVLIGMMNTCQQYWMFHISETREGQLNEKYSWGWVVRAMREELDYYNTYGVPKL